MALISTSLIKTRLKPAKNYKTQQLLAFEIKTDAGNIVIIGIYRPLRPMCGEYQLLLEIELSEICNWASLQSNFVVAMGDLNLDRMRPDKPEGKLLLDHAVEQCFECLISKPTRTEKSRTETTNTLIDVLLSNRPELFQCTGNNSPCLSDHSLIQSILKHTINPNRSKVITFRSYKTRDLELAIFPCAQRVKVRWRKQ